MLTESSRAESFVEGSMLRSDISVRVNQCSERYEVLLMLFLLHVEA